MEQIFDFYLSFVRCHIFYKLTDSITSSDCISWTINDYAETLKVDPIHDKLNELGVNEEWLIGSKMTPQMARDLLKGISCLKEMYKEKKLDQ